MQKMNKNESVSGTLNYIDDMTNKRAQRKSPNIVPQKNSVQVKKIQAPRNESISAAEPHLKQFAGMLSEELANVKKLRVEELEKIRFEYAEKIRLEEEAKIHQEKERERIRAQLAEQAFMEKERERIRAELLAEFKHTPQPVYENAQYDSLNFENVETIDLTEEPIIEEAIKQNNIHEDYLAKQNNLDESLLMFSNKKLAKTQVNEQTDFVTFEDLQKHYSDFINKINTQLSTLGGGGEVVMRGLDDLDMTTFQDGDFVSYDATTGKFIGGSITPEGVEGGVLEGGTY